jgi:hypothetical protein
MQALNIFGLVCTLMGAGIGTYGVWLTQDEAIEIGVSRYGGTREQNLTLPAVKSLLRQSRCAVGGFALIGVGTILQIIAALR